MRCLERFAAALAPAARLFRAAREREAKTNVRLYNMLPGCIKGMDSRAQIQVLSDRE